MTGATLFILLLLAPALPAPPKSLTADLEAFTSRSWPSVFPAKDRLESREGEAIPALIKLVFRQERAPLVDTADLIYPGARTFHGHGWLIDYDLDSLSARAGWLLEAITFEDFGFSSGTIREDRLMEAAVAGKGDVPLAQVLPQPGVPRDFGASAEKARRWWADRSPGWTRFAAVIAALQSTSAHRQMLVLSWLRHGQTPCNGLSLARYQKELRPLVKRLAGRGPEEVRQQARLLLEDREGYWFKAKAERRPAR